MWKCPICNNEEKSKYVCRKCGYDTRKDFVQWRTVSKVTEEDSAERDCLLSEYKEKADEGMIEKEIPRKFSFSKGMIGICLILAACVFGLVFCMDSGSESEETINAVQEETFTEDTVTESEARKEIVFEGRIADLYGIDENSEKNMLHSAMAHNPSEDIIPGLDVKQMDVYKIKFLDSMENVPDGAWDASASGDGSVAVWIEDGGCLYFAANGNIIGNPNSRALFSAYRNLIEINFNQCFNTSKIIDMELMFYQCNSLDNLDLSCFDTSRVTNMENMFTSCIALSTLDVSSFNTSQVTNMNSMFYECKSLRSLDVSGFDMSQVTDMSSMFSRCESLESLDVSKFDTSQVTSMRYMFCECKSLESLDVSKFDTSQVTDMRSMFRLCRSLESLDVSGFDTSRVTNMNQMFLECKSLGSLDVSKFDMSQVEFTGGMFYGCESLSPEVYEGIWDGN